MRTLSDEGVKLADEVARRHGVGRDVVVTLLQALERGNGVQAQFSHPDLGGLGQWSRGGMIMVGDMFNNALKARVDALCTELSDLMHTRAMFKPVPRGEASAAASQSSWQSQSSPDATWSSMSFASAWWPEGCGRPSSSGSQNDMRYACFPDTHRVAIQHGGIVRIYDTGGHRITGVSQQQSGSQDLSFTGPDGTVRLRELRPVSEEPAPREGSPPDVHAEPVRPQTADQSEIRRPAERTTGADRPSAPLEAKSTDDDIFAKIERLHELQQRGILSEAEFAEKKKDLLARI